MTEAERLRRLTIAKFLVVGYRGLTDRERQVIAYTVTRGGCPSCGDRR